MGILQAGAEPPLYQKNISFQNISKKLGPPILSKSKNEAAKDCSLSAAYPDLFLGGTREAFTSYFTSYTAENRIGHWPTKNLWASPVSGPLLLPLACLYFVANQYKRHDQKGNGKSGTFKKRSIFSFLSVQGQFMLSRIHFATHY